MINYGAKKIDICGKCIRMDARDGRSDNINGWIIDIITKLRS